MPWNVTCTAPLALDPALLTRLDAGIEQLGQLPVLDQTLVRVRELSDDPDASTEELVAALSADPEHLRQPAAVRQLRPQRLAGARHDAAPGRDADRPPRGRADGAGGRGLLVLRARAGRRRDGRGQLAVHAIQVAGGRRRAGAPQRRRRRGRAPRRAPARPRQARPAGRLRRRDARRDRRRHARRPRARGRRARAAGRRPRRRGRALRARRRGSTRASSRPSRFHHGAPEDGVPVTPTVRAVQAANATVAMLNGHPADDVLLNAALADLGLHAQRPRGGREAAMPAAMSGGRGPAALHDQIARLEHEARTDDLTGLANRRHWTTTARDALAERPATVVLVDVDHFKAVNDQHGHPTGDYVLIEIGRILGGHGFAGRLGGDEYALLTQRPGSVGRRRPRRSSPRSPRRSAAATSPSRSRSAPRRPGRPAATSPSSSSAPTRRSTRPSAPAAGCSAPRPTSRPSPRGPPARSRRRRTAPGACTGRRAAASWR